MASSFEQTQILFEQTWIPFTQRWFYVKFGWNWSSGSGEEDRLNLSIYFRYFIIISPLKKAGPFIWINLNPLPPQMIYVKFGWNWPSGSGEEDFLNMSIFSAIISLWERVGPFIWINLNPLHPRILCANFF